MQTKILIVDDDQGIVRMLTRRLKKAGYQVDTAHNGTQGIEKILTWKPDLILMDMYMPGMNGYETARFLRQKHYQGLIVALTASVMAHEANKSLDAGCDYFIAKPIGVDFEQQLQQILEEWHGQNFNRG